MRVTSKGQVTIPIEIRRRFGLEEGSEVEFVIEDNTVRIMRASRQETQSQALIRRLRGSGGHSGMSTDEIMELLRGED